MIEIDSVSHRSVIKDSFVVEVCDAGCGTKQHCENTLLARMRAANDDAIRCFRCIHSGCKKRSTGWCARSFCVATCCRTARPPQSTAWSSSSLRSRSSFGRFSNLPAPLQRLPPPLQRLPLPLQRLPPTTRHQLLHPPTLRPARATLRRLSPSPHCRDVVFLITARTPARTRKERAKHASGTRKRAEG